MKLAVGDEIAVIRKKLVVMAHVRRVVEREFFWRSDTGGLGRCRIRDEGSTWVNASSGEREIAAFRVGVAL